ncbi:MAG: HAD-IA family hydrolase, partial [Candidatus Micrarchaeota archaeon]|nr:HAD-IA family hydrolase [Candidatus Micrarchaeota archaeon]
HYDINSYRKYLSATSGKGLRTVNRIVSPLEDKIDAGLIRAGQFEYLISKRLVIQRNRVNYPQFFKSSAKPNKPLLRRLMVLRKRYKLAFLTNAGYMEYKVALKLMGFPYFDCKIVSCYLKLIKPDPRIYKHAIKKLGLRPSEILFVDDKKKNADAARQAGMAAILFKNNRGLFGRSGKLSRYN